MNDEAITMLHLEKCSPIGEGFDTISRVLSDNEGDLTGLIPVHTTISHLHEDRPYYYAIDMYPVFDSIKRLECRLIVMRDITDIIKSKNALKEAGKKLGLLTSITRHDILNQIMIISFYIDEIAHTPHSQSHTATSIERVKDATTMIKQLISFTSGYQDLGITEPGWYNITHVMNRAWNTRNVPSTISCHIDANIVIYADMLLEKVFFNLIDNSLRHGKDITSITVTSRISDHCAIILYEDNGGGISSEDKIKIFRRGFGKNTGYGLFLVREILGITSITIEETGIPGTGVRFEMTVPHGGFMIPVES